LLLNGQVIVANNYCWVPLMII